MCFNPSVGILGVQAVMLTSFSTLGAMFQSLGRDSGRSSPRTSVTGSSLWPSFNPSVGILGVQAGSSRKCPIRSTCFNPSVGILGVQAGTWTDEGGGIYSFQSLGRDSGCSSVFVYGCHQSSLPRFNPSVGILGVQASAEDQQWSGMYLFQSLGRDSGCSSRPS